METLEATSGAETQHIDGAIHVCCLRQKELIGRRDNRRVMLIQRERERDERSHLEALVRQQVIHIGGVVQHGVDGFRQLLIDILRETKERLNVMT